MTKDSENIGRYSVMSELGRGSMGVVHLAHDPLMDRDLAIKTILLPRGLDGSHKAEFTERFLREAQAAGKLSHPGIVTIYDFNGESGHEPPFIAMEYVEGPTLHELICAEGALHPEWALSMAETLADALRVAHESGVVHRDIKPANILVRESDGVAKIADFGVARIRASDRDGCEHTYGSPAYMAPECVRGEAADERSDLFALAVIFYEAVSGHRPFEADGYDAIRHSIANDPPTPIRTHAPDLSPAFDHFFERALAKKPCDRFESGAAFCDALLSLRNSQQSFGTGVETMITTVPELAAATTESRPSRSLLRWATAGIGVVLVVLLFGLVRDPAVTEAPAPAVFNKTAAVQPEPDPGPAMTLAVTSEVPEPATSDPSTMTPFEDSAPIEMTPVKPPTKTATPPQKKSAPAPAPNKTAPPEVQEAAPIENTAAPVPVAEPVIEIPPVAPPPGQLEIHVKSGIKSGTLTLLVDGDEVYYTELSAESGRMGRAFKKAVGKGTQNLDANIEIQPGTHTIEARVFNEAKSSELVERVEIEVESGQARSLQIVAGGAFGRRLEIELD